jgi:predicted lipid-binding transport protein (Tim44 family)
MGDGMSGESLLIILLVGLIAGWLAGQVVRGTGFGLIADIAIGIVGALIGSWFWIWNRTRHHRSYDRRHSLAFDSQAGLSSRPLVINRR